MTAGLGPVTPGCRTRLTAHYGRGVTGWLDQVPGLLSDAARSFGVAPLGYHDNGHASVLALASAPDGGTVMLKAWYDRTRYRHETAALAHWQPVNDQVVRGSDSRRAVACLELAGGLPGGVLRPGDDQRRVAAALARLHSVPLPARRFPELDGYLRRIWRRIGRRVSRSGMSRVWAGLPWGPVPKSAGGRAALLHGDLYRENVPFAGDGHPVFLDPLPMIGDPAFDWAFFTVYYDLASDPGERLALAAEASGIDRGTLLPWCLMLCLDGLLYYRETGDARQVRMTEVTIALAGLDQHGEPIRLVPFGMRAAGAARTSTMKRLAVMHDARTLLDLGEDAARRLARRGYTLDLAAIKDVSSRRSAAVGRCDELRAESKRVARQVGEAARSGDDAGMLKDRARVLKDQVRALDEERDAAEAELRDLLLGIPNLPDDDVPEGDSEEFNVEVRRHGTPRSFSFTPRDHVDLGEAMGILDFARATRLSGPRFSVARGAGAALERALATFFLDLHVRRHGYTEFSLPELVTRQTMTGTGQLPKFADDLFKTGVVGRELFLIPTAEVPLTNLHAGEILSAEALPYAYTAWTRCFRSEAGSYGRDTRGLLRLHQFSKVELVRVCRAEDSRAELEIMLAHAETCLKELDLAYRVVKLAAGDLGFSAAFTYDIEVWLPSQNTYREISSCSDCGTFQARRAAIRTKTKDGQRGLAATLNGSGLPVGRTMAALLEQHQQPDGSVTIPHALAAFTGFTSIGPDGMPHR
jgi:seryl-tRNA synthetase